MNTKYMALVLLALLVGGIGYVMVRGSVRDDNKTSDQTVAYKKVDDSQYGSSTTADISDAERAGLAWMVEEEKLARDVYNALFETWGTRIFSNIAQSEQTHMDAVSRLLDRYGIENPARDEEAGVFANEELQTLYTTLVEKGSVSLTDALTVGATIEDMDIRDLQKYISETERQDVITVYEHLKEGSQNHLRAFTSQLGSRGTFYIPQHISLDEFNAIMASGTERSMKGGNR